MIWGIVVQDSLTSDIIGDCGPVGHTQVWGTEDKLSVPPCCFKPKEKKTRSWNICSQFFILIPWHIVQYSPSWSKTEFNLTSSASGFDFGCSYKRPWGQVCLTPGACLFISPSLISPLSRGDYLHHFHFFFREGASPLHLLPRGFEALNDRSTAKSNLFAIAGTVKMKHGGENRWLKCSSLLLRHFLSLLQSRNWHIMMRTLSIWINKPKEACFQQNTAVETMLFTEFSDIVVSIITSYVLIFLKITSLAPPSAGLPFYQALTILLLCVWSQSYTKAALIFFFCTPLDLKDKGRGGPSP